MSVPPNEDFSGLLGAMSQLQDRLAHAESAANARSVVGSSAQGLVSIGVSGEFSFDRVSIDPSVIDPDDPSLLEDLILAALRDASSKLRAVRTEAMGGAVTEALGSLFAGNGPATPTSEIEAREIKRDEDA
jgi:hypothetical protein